jgi:hypothetical protein
MSPIGNSQNGEFETAHCHPPVTQLSPIGNNQNGEFEAAHSRTANLQWLSATRRICSGFQPQAAHCRHPLT